MGSERAMKLVHFGAGRIGRSFIGQLFSRAGWEVVFVDVDRRIIAELNRRKQYRVVVKDKEGGVIVVRNVRGVHADDLERVSEEIAGADLLSTAVGKSALTMIAVPIARGIIRRHESSPERAVDIILCENMKDAALFFRDTVAEHLPEGFPIDSAAGFVETSIGKMVPLMSAEEREKDPLLVYAERYNTLIVDRNGFKNEVPVIPGLKPKSLMKAWVDRKLYIHNLGHAVLAYTSYALFPDYIYMWQAVSNEALRAVTKGAMWESGRALMAQYPHEFDTKSIGSHIDDLLERFGNRALGDTVYRVGMDLYRKLGPDDRLIGGVKLCLKHHIRPDFISLGAASAMFFRAAGEDGRMFERDRRFFEQELSRGIDHVLTHVCGLEDRETRRVVASYYDSISKGGLDIERLAQNVC